MRTEIVAFAMITTVGLSMTTGGCGDMRTPYLGGMGHGDMAGHADGGIARDLSLAQLPDLPPASTNVCLAGDYVGTFEGVILIGGLIPTKTQGTVNLTLGSGGGEFFDVMNGKLAGMASSNPYSADLVGRLDCSTLKLVGGMLKNGQVTVKPFTYMFEGPLKADYDQAKVAFVNGTWDIVQIPMPSSKGNGTWTATHK